MPNPIIGAHRYFAFEKETGAGSAWGTRPTTPVIVHAPVSNYTVRLVRNVFEHSPFTGIAQQHHAQSNNSIVQGQIAMPLYGVFDSGPAVSLAEYFLSLATDDQESLASRPSMRAWDMQVDGDDNLIAGHEDSGLRVNKMTLKGDQNGIVLTLDVMGKTQIAQTNDPGDIPDDRHSLTEFLFSDSTLSVGGSAVAVEEWQWEMDWSLKPLFLNATRPTYLHAQQCRHTLTFKPVKTAATYDAYLRLTPQTELETILVIKGLHDGTATDNYTRGTFTFPRTSLMDAEDAISYGDFGYQPIRLKALKPDTGLTDYTVEPVWDTVA